MRTASEYLAPARVDRQLRVVDQERLDGLRVGLAGGGDLADLVDLCLAGLGVGCVARFGESDGFLFGMGLDLSSPYQERFSAESYEGLDLLIDCSGDHRGCDVPYVGFCEDGLGSGGGSYNGLLSGVLAGLAGQRVVQYAEGSEHGGVTFPVIGGRSGGRALVVGAGGTGTYAGLFAALSGYAVDVMDHDRVEAHNLNRQVLYDGLVGESKASSLRSRLDELGCAGRAYEERLDEENVQVMKGYDVVFSCVDKLAPRRVMNEAAVGYGVHLVDGGTSAWGGRVMGYRPGSDPCVGCQVSLDGEDRDTESCAEADPSIVMPNMIIGSLMVEHALRGADRPFRFDGRMNVAYESVPESIRESCGCVS